MFGSTEVKSVIYVCNKCQKERNLTIPAKLIRTENISNIIEFVDVHRCDENNLSAVKCFIDNHLVVRSQVHIKSTHYGYETDRDFSAVSDEQDLYAQLGIPAPKKIEMSKTNIESKNFRKVNILGMEIKDKIRNSEYIFEKRAEGHIFNIKSTLGFVEINLHLDGKVANKVLKKWKQQVKSSVLQMQDQRFPFNSVKKWIQHVANSLESLVYLDVEVLKLIADYLDDNILIEPSERKITELDLLVNSTISFPKASSESIQKFNDKKTILYADLSPNQLIFMKDLLVYCLGNYEKSVLYVFNEKGLHRDFSEYIFALSYLVFEKLVTMIRLEFT
ncbi:MAG: hypothetical protein HeimAB125_16920 [Candidatus Heimdallarchaeota archaeon AB_125]|nr:MAG: hypothetical protein HeimAB125_16920 [Candidatus Heimdallarchaeota archaeon AB_125]